MTRLLATALALTAAFGSDAATAQGKTDALDRAIERVQTRLARRDVWQDRSTWENAWVAKTEHFLVRTVHTYGFAKQIADDLESMLGHFQTTLGVQVVPVSRVEVHIFPDIPSYNQFGNQYGQEHSSLFSAFLAIEHPQRIIGAVMTDNRTQMRMDITYAALHRWLEDAFPGRTPPVWVREGLASYFASFWAHEWTLAEFIRRRDANELLSMANLMGDSLASYQNKTQTRTIQLATLFSYLFAYKEETRTTPERGPFRDYLVSMLRGEVITGSPVHRIVRRMNDLQDEMKHYDFNR